MDMEYLPSIERTKFERGKTMEDKKDKIEALDEKMGLESYLDDHEEKNVDAPDLDSIEKHIDKMALPADDCDQEEPMTIERKINMLSKIFPLAINDRVRNSLDEEGVIDLVGLDSRGVIYLVKYKEGVITWETNLTKVNSLTTQAKTEDPSIKTDIPSTDQKYTGQHRVD